MQNITRTITKHSATVLVAIFAFSLQSCSESPDKFFANSFFNTNAINDFATPSFAKQINDSTIEFDNIPSTKNKGDEAISVVNNKVLYLEKSLNDIKALHAGSDDRKAIQDKSVALYEYIIPVYKNEYTNYAKLCDSKADQAKKDKIINGIEQKYATKFEQMYIDLMNDGKAFAKENNLNVNWGE